MGKPPVKNGRAPSQLQTPEPSPRSSQELGHHQISYNSPPFLGLGGSSQYNSQQGSPPIVSVSSSPFQMGGGNVDSVSRSQFVLPPTTSRRASQQQQVVIVQNSATPEPSAGGRKMATPSRSRKTPHDVVVEDEVQILADKGMPPNSGRRGGARARLDSFTGSEMSFEDSRQAKTRETERKRRMLQKESADKLRELVPGLREGKSRKVGEGVVMQKAGEYIEELHTKIAEMEAKAKKDAEGLERLRAATRTINKTAFLNMVRQTYLYCLVKHLESLKPQGQRLVDTEPLKPFLYKKEFFQYVYQHVIAQMKNNDPYRVGILRELSVLMTEVRPLLDSPSHAGFVPLEAASPGTGATPSLPSRLLMQQFMLACLPQRQQLRDQIRITTVSPGQQVLPNPVHQIRLSQFRGVVQGTPRGSSVKISGGTQVTHLPGGVGSARFFVRGSQEGKPELYAKMPDGSVKNVLLQQRLAPPVSTETAVPEERITEQLSLLSVKQEEEEVPEQQENPEAMGFDLCRVKTEPTEELEDYSLGNVKEEPDVEQYSMDNVKQESGVEDYFVDNVDQEQGFGGYCINGVDGIDIQSAHGFQGNANALKEEVFGDYDDEHGAAGGAPRPSINTDWLNRDIGHPAPPPNDSDSSDDEDGGAGGGVMGERHPVERALQAGQDLTRSLIVHHVNMMTLQMDLQHLDNNPIFKPDFLRLRSREEDTRRLQEICDKTWAEVMDERKQKEAQEIKRLCMQMEEEKENLEEAEDDWNGHGTRSRSGKGRRSAGARGGNRRGGRGGRQKK